MIGVLFCKLTICRGTGKSLKPSLLLKSLLSRAGVNKLEPTGQLWQVTSFVPYMLHFYTFQYFFFLLFPGCSEGKESTCNAEDLGLTPGLERSPGGGQGNPLQYPVFLPGESHGQRSLTARAGSLSTGWL